MKIVLGLDSFTLVGNEIKNKVIREKGKSLTYIPENYTIIDLETTGLDPTYDEIIEIGALKVKNGRIIDKFESLIKPEGYYYSDDDDNEIFYYVDEFITKLTGITNEMLHNAPNIENILPKFLDFIQGEILVGHNIHFDLNFLYDIAIDKFNYKLQNNFVDLLRISRKIYPEFKNYKLNTIAENLNIDTQNSHRALADCHIIYNCLLKISNHIIENNIDLSQLFSKKNNSVDLRTLKAETNYFDENHIFYNKYCTFTGKLEKMNRKEAAQLVVNLGGKCLNSVTKQTNFLILGNLDYCSNIKGGKSSKLKKAEKLILEGYDIQILSENVFYDLINNK